MDGWMDGWMDTWIKRCMDDMDGLNGWHGWHGWRTRCRGGACVCREEIVGRGRKKYRGHDAGEGARRGGKLYGIFCAQKLNKYRGYDVGRRECVWGGIVGEARQKILET